MRSFVSRDGTIEVRQQHDDTIVLKVNTTFKIWEWFTEDPKDRKEALALVEEYIDEPESFEDVN